MSNESSKALRHTPHSWETPEDDPFRDDVFQRKPLAENLTKLLLSFAEQSFVLGINGVWGSGKTVFLDMWDAHLKNNKFHTLRFNAWENDHSDDPFASILSEFRELVDSSDANEKSILRKSFDSLKKKALPILKKSASVAVKYATAGMLDINANAEAVISNLAEETAKHALDKVESDKKSIKAFREELIAFVKKVETTGKPVVYLIDELDRCRPTYAISVLERIKHLLNVNGVVFVFAWDRTQLSQTIQNIYGNQTDSGGYLLRFVDLEFNLSIGGYDALCQSLMHRFGLKQYLIKEERASTYNLIKKTFPKIAKIFKLSVREQEKSFIALSIFCRISFSEESLVIDPLILLIMLRIKRPDIYHAICSLHSKSNETENRYTQLVESDLPTALGKPFWHSEIGGYFEGYLLFQIPKKAWELKIEKLNLIAREARNSREYCREYYVVMGFDFSSDYERSGGLISFLIKQLEFTEAFYL